eukprot:UN01666
MAAIKSLNFKKKLAKKMNCNRPLPNWVRMKTDNTVRYNAKRRQWRRTKLGNQHVSCPFAVFNFLILILIPKTSKQTTYNKIVLLLFCWSNRLLPIFKVTC